MSYTTDMKSVHLIAVAIVAVGALVAGAIVYINMGDTDVSPMRTDAKAHVYGNADAPTTVVTFSDYECPFCARLHTTLKRIVDESEGTIQWEYRHLPLSNHRHALSAAVVGECIAQERGNAAFWHYTDQVLSNQARVTEEYLVSVATETGIEESVLEVCMQSQTVQDQVNSDARMAKAFGGSGTPFSIVVFADGRMQPVSGALPYAQWLAVLGL